MTDGATEDDLTIEVRRGASTDDELAALIAVVSESYAREQALAVVEDEPERTAWALSQRSLRTPLRRELGWSRFGG